VMPLIDRHAHSAFSWIELGTTDQNAAKHFYTSLFGWEFIDSPMGPNDFYTMFTLGGRNAAAAYTLRPEQLSHGVPPHWNLYIDVANADESARRATELGGSVLGGPFDVFTFGRMAVIADPTGAVFSVWEARSHTGVGVYREAGSLCWADLNTPDPATASKFYAALFGYEIDPGESGYLHIINGHDYIGGVPPSSQRNPHSPPHWMIYIQVDDCAASTEKAKALGASIYTGPVDIPTVGIMTVLADPQGATFTLFQPARRA
jgi:predicted enzyme related to lactoylglutathione lyase